MLEVNINNSKFKNICGCCPVNTGIYDVEKQKELSAKYEQIDMIKKELSEKLTELTEIIIS